VAHFAPSTGTLENAEVAVGVTGITLQFSTFVSTEALVHSMLCDACSLIKYCSQGAWRIVLCNK